MPLCIHAAVNLPPDGETSLGAAGCELHGLLSRLKTARSLDFSLRIAARLSTILEGAAINASGGQKNRSCLPVKLRRPLAHRPVPGWPERKETAMKRSVINRYIFEARAFFAQNGFILPPFADWTPTQWAQCGREVDELCASRLGWDVTDFNSGNFESLGLTLFTLRNGSAGAGSNSKTYAEKIMFVREGQVTPFHYHARKTEDIINRGGTGTGRLAVQLYNSDGDGGFAQSAISVVCDGVGRSVDPGGTIVLGPGESITLTPFLDHEFYAVDGHALIGEVSSVNDDETDNFFKNPLPRFPEIDEDEPRLRLLCNEYRVL